MALKRPVEAGEASHKKHKRAKVESASRTNEKPKDKHGKAEKRTPKAVPATPSVLLAEETSFPRGGASVLTPLEHKQIQAQATRDVLFEQSGSKAPKRDFETGSDEDAEDGQTKKESQLQSKKRKKKSEGKAEKLAGEAPPLRVEGLSYKRLVPGLLVLGQVSGISTNEITLALPNNLVGYIPITQVSDQITNHVERLLAETDESDEAGGDELEDVDLNAAVKIGQYLRAYVTSTGDDSAASEKSRKRIELSINPSQANSGILSKDLVRGVMLVASVKSVEDHGLIMDLGYNQPGVNGFVSQKDLDSSVKLSDFKEGSVHLAVVVRTEGNVVKLSLDTDLSGPSKKHAVLREAPNIDVFLPGTAVEALVTDSTSFTVTAKIMGMLDATADLIQSGAACHEQDNIKRFAVGSKVMARIICNFPLSEQRKVGISFLDHVLHFRSRPTANDKATKKRSKDVALSSFVESAKVTKVKPGVGIVMDIGVAGIPGFAHISRLSDKKVESISEDSGLFKVGSTHRARVVGFNAMDGLYLVSLEDKILGQPFLRVEDVPIGSVVNGKVEKLLITERGVDGVFVSLADNITGLVPEMHLADIQLQHPEKKFREGVAVKARVLSTNLEKRQIRLTLKKTLINSEAKIWKDYNEVAPGSESVGTLTRVLPGGALMSFYGPVKAFLPVAEMSDSYISDPQQHFRVGQVLSVRCLDVDSKAGRMTVSCRDPAAFGEVQKQAFRDLQIGAIVGGVVIEKSKEDVSVEFTGGLKGVLSVDHLTDGSQSKNASSLKRIAAGQKLNDLVVLDKREQHHVVELTNKPSLVKAARAEKLLCSFEDVKERAEVDGFVRNITTAGAYIQFGAGLVGLLLKSHVESAAQMIPDFGLRLGQSISLYVLSVDHAQRRFLLTQTVPQAEPEREKGEAVFSGIHLEGAVDGITTEISQYTVGKLTKARIIGVKDTQLNVQLADNVQGRVDMSEAFEQLDEIKDRKRPSRQFKAKQIISVRILGMHDARTHRFLPITHRNGRSPMFELSIRAARQSDGEPSVLSLASIELGSTWIAIINNHSERCVWVSLSPNVRGRIDLMELTDDVSLLEDLDTNFPIGSAVNVRVKSIDVAMNRLDLTATAFSGLKQLSFEEIKQGMVLPGRVVKTTEQHLIVQLSDGVSGVVGPTELHDDFSLASTTKHNKNDIIRVCVLEVDRSNKRIHLSIRPSKILSSSLPVKDRYISSISQIKVNDVVRGFVKNVADKGLFVSLSPTLTGFVRITDLFDAYVKDWKASFQVGQLVEGKVISADAHSNQLQLSLKSSLLDKDYVPPVKLQDLQVGQIVTGKVRKVEDFGVFVLVDNSNGRISGLCHRTQIADGPVEDVKRIYGEGDKVKAKVLKVDVDRQRVNFGLKASYFVDADSGEEDSLEEDDEGGVEIDANEEADDDLAVVDGGVDLAMSSVGRENDTTMMSDQESEADDDGDAMQGLSGGGFDWTGEGLKAANDIESSEDSEQDTSIRKKKNRRPKIKEDKTGDLDRYGPQSTADFERQLLGEPNSSSLWVQYMAFLLQLNEVDQAREIVERALRTIHIRETDEKLNVWIALLNLENTYGSEESVEEAFARAKPFFDPLDIHQRLATIYIGSAKHEKAEQLFEAMLKQKEITNKKSFWLNYATFLMTTLKDANRARALLPRSLQSVPAMDHCELTSDFGALEFRSPEGDAERGRTIFEGLIDSFPKRDVLWDRFVALEKAHGAAENVRGLYERMAGRKMKRGRAAKVFARWEDYEEGQGNAKGVEKVRAKARLVESEREKARVED